MSVSHRIDADFEPDDRFNHEYGRLTRILLYSTLPGESIAAWSILSTMLAYCEGLALGETYIEASVPEISHYTGFRGRKLERAVEHLKAVKVLTTELLEDGMVRWSLSVQGIESLKQRPAEARGMLR